MSLDITTSTAGAWTVLSLTGEVDIATAPPLREALVEAQGGSAKVVVDFSGVEFMDSTGLGVLVGALKRTRMSQGDLVLAALGSASKKVFEITGLTDVFEITDTVDAATGTTQ
jgi:anti-sigma B factor antagonist